MKEGEEKVAAGLPKKVVKEGAAVAAGCCCSADAGPNLGKEEASSS